MQGSEAVAMCIMLKLIAEHLHENVTQQVRQFIKKGCPDPVLEDHKGQKRLPQGKWRRRSLTHTMNIHLLTAVH